MEISFRGVPSSILAQRAQSVALKVGSPTVVPPSITTDQFQPSPDSVTEIKLPKLVETSPSDLKRGYLWQAVPLPSPIDGLLGAVIGFGPIPKLLGLEPAPKGKPEPNPLGFSWNGSSQADFETQATELKQKLGDTSATEIGKRRIKGGSNANFLVTLSNGVSAVWTPKANEKSDKSLRANLPQGRQAEREEAAFIVDQHLGHLARVPPAVSTGLEGRPGSLKLLVSQGKDASDADPALSFSDQDYRRMALFDHVIGNLDRHKGNFLLDDHKRPVPIDHGLSFPTKNSDQGFHNFRFDATFQLNDDEKATLGKFLAQREQVTQDLKHLLEPEAVQAMFERVDRMLEIGWISHEWREK